MGPKNIFFIIALLLLASCVQQPEQYVTPPAADNETKNVDMLGGNDLSDVKAEDVNYGAATGFLAMPEKEGEYPGIVMIHEWWGLNDNIKETAKQLASNGYVVLAVDLYNGKVTGNQDEARKLVTEVRGNPAPAIENLKSASKFLKNHPSVQRDAVASMGWCFGGGMSLQLALNEELAATVIYYGTLETDPEKLSSIKWPVLGIFGSEDTSIPVDSVNEFEASLDEIGVENEIYVYEGVGHAFANPSGASYALEETKDAWQKTLDFLDRNLKESDDGKDENDEDAGEGFSFNVEIEESFTRQPDHSNEIRLEGNEVTVDYVFSKPNPCTMMAYTVEKEDFAIDIVPRQATQSGVCAQVIAYDEVEIKLGLDEGKYTINIYDFFEQDEPALTKEIEVK